MKSFFAFAIFSIFVLLAGVLFFKPKTQFTYYHDVAPILQAHCLPCHNQNGPGGFSLSEFLEVKKRASAIKTVTASRYMPPWKADPSFRHFPDERILTQQQISTIAQWIDGGMLVEQNTEAFLKESMAVPVYSKISDITCEVNEKTCVNANIHDYYVSYPFFLNNKEPIDIENFELQSNNEKILHHAWLFIMDRKTAFEFSPEWKKEVRAVPRKTFDFVAQKEMLGYLLYLPGKTNLKKIPGTAKKIPADAVLMIDLHYFNKTKNSECDKPKLKVYRAPNNKNREVNFLVLDEFSITHPPFVIPADTIIRFVLKTPATENNYTLLKITPHMHFLGKSMKVFALTPQNDTINLVRINDWDFNWQETYSFSPLVTIPKGTVIWAEAVYDNTDNNPMNPNIPPVEVHQGFKSSDEMFQIAIEYLDYKPGDEFLKPE